MKHIDVGEIGKWLAVTACIVMAGILSLHGKEGDSAGFGWAAFAIIIFL